MKKKNSCSQQRSSILIIALWSVCLLTSLAVILGFQVRQQLVLVKRLQERENLRMIAEAGVIRSAAFLNSQPEEGFSALNQKWSHDPETFKDIAVGGGRFSVWYENCPEGIRYGLIDEESKVNINKADIPVMARLFNLLGLEEQEARDLAESIVDWRDVDSELSGPGGAEDAYYRALPLSYEAKDAEFQTPDELLLVKGADENNFLKIKEHITIYGDGRVNLNTAGRPVLLALGLSENVVDLILVFRNGKDNVSGTADDSHFEEISEVALKINEAGNLSQAEQAQINNLISGSFVTLKSSNFTVRSSAFPGRGKFNQEVTSVISRKGKILYWKEF